MQEDGCQTINNPLGHVTLYFASGDRYEGEKRGNKFEGYGKYFFANKDRYCIFITNCFIIHTQSLLDMKESGETTKRTARANSSSLGIVNDYITSSFLSYTFFSFFKRR